MFTGNRVVITGMGVLAANGVGRKAFWSSLLEGRSGVGPVTLFDASKLSCRIAGEVSDFDPLMVPGLTAKGVRRMSRASQLAVAAVSQALDDARLDFSAVRDTPLPLFTGVSTTALDVIAGKPRPWTVVSAVPHSVATAVAAPLGIRCRLVTLSTGCTSGMDAVRAAAENVRSGEGEVAVAVAADSSIDEYTMSCFCSAGALSCRNDEPEKAGRPFDMDRDGGVISEGGGCLILENREHALARGARIYGEVGGYGGCADTPGAAEGEGLGVAMRLALDSACLATSRIDAISAHAPSDRHLDVMEVNCIKDVFGEHAFRIPVTSIKGCTGNSLGVAGVHQIIASLLTMETGKLPSTTNLETPATACDLDHVPGVFRRYSPSVCLINSHGVGRGNVSLVLVAPESAESGAR